MLTLIPRIVAIVQFLMAHQAEIEAVIVEVEKLIEGLVPTPVK